jgi:tRNA(Ile)-lysidine synthase
VQRAKKNARRKTKQHIELSENLDRVLRKRGLVKPGERIGVAVSGGADSVALLRILLESQKTLGIVVLVVHFNHKLRGRASETDERFVAKLAEQHGLEFFVAREDIAARTKHERGNVEEVARKARYAFFEKLGREERVARIAVAHTADDQAETVLAHILRGTGLSGLRGIHAQTGIVFRPLLGVRRWELRRYLKTLKQAWREDATNQDTKRTRARIRKKLLPMLEKQFNPGVVEHLCQLAELAGEDENFLEMQATDWLKKSAQRTSEGVTVGLGDFVRAPRALRSRALRTVVAEVKTRGGQLSLEHVEAVLQLAEQQESGKALQLPGGVEVRRERDVLQFRACGTEVKSAAGKKVKEYAHKVDLRGGKAELRLVELSIVLHFRVIDWPAEGRETKETGAVLDRSQVLLPLVVRNWRPGDAMRPQGHQKAHKLGRLLNEKSISRWEKVEWPVLTSGGKLAWVRGLGECVEFAVRPETRKVLVITEEPLS